MPLYATLYTDSKYYRIRKNASTSPLLRLPSEVRENILINLIGDNLIHVKYLDSVELYLANKAKKDYLDAIASQAGESQELSIYTATTDGEDNKGNHDDHNDSSEMAGHDTGLDLHTGLNDLSVSQESPRPYFCHAICVANQSEQSAYKEIVAGNTIVPEGESPEFYVACCEERHANCKMCGNGPMFLYKEDQQALRVDLNVLGVCRQLYEEANHLLWATNTFSFEDPKSFEKFSTSLNLAQKHNLTSIHISTSIGGYNSRSNTYRRARFDDSYWGKALKMSGLNILRGIQTLHLCVNQEFKCVTSLRSSDLTEKQIEEAQESDLEYILRLRALSVKHVTVIVSDNAKTLATEGKTAHRWTVTKKNEYAASIRLKLMDPDGADLMKTKAEAASLARRNEARDRAAARVLFCKQNLNDKKAEVVRTAMWASRQETRAALAAQEADRVLKKGSKKAARLQRNAAKWKGMVTGAKEIAELAVARVESYQETLTDAREKYKRAMLRLGYTLEDIQDEEEAEDLTVGPAGSDMDVAEDQAHGDTEDDALMVLDSEEESSDDDEDDEVSVDKWEDYDVSSLDADEDDESSSSESSSDEEDEEDDEVSSDDEEDNQNPLYGPPIPKLW